MSGCLNEKRQSCDSKTDYWEARGARFRGILVVGVEFPQLLVHGGERSVQLGRGFLAACTQNCYAGQSIQTAPKVPGVYCTHVKGAWDVAEGGCRMVWGVGGGLEVEIVGSCGKRERGGEEVDQAMGGE